MNKYIIDYKDLKELLERDKELSRLEAGGVDNWYCDDEYFEDYDTEDLIKKYKEYEENQQKEFINWLEEEITLEIQRESVNCETTNKKYILEEILQKYKSIVGGNKDEK